MLTRRRHNRYRWFSRGKSANARQDVLNIAPEASPDVFINHPFSKRAINAGKKVLKRLMPPAIDTVTTADGENDACVLRPATPRGP